MVVAVLLLPPLGLLAYQWRGKPALAEAGIVAGSLPWALMLFTRQDAPRDVELVPLQDLSSWIPAQVVGNLLVLAAFGFFLPMRFGWAASLSRVFGLALVTSTLIEVLQWVSAIGRVSSVDDVIVNTVGAVAAAALSRRWWTGRASVVTPEMVFPDGRDQLNGR
ncbi:hypothetical protein Ahu01nite_031600 [Winogradskya humida]|uniref:VanZ-like domain-containing protein n=2 Tax=Winogradskya humida TaxID=113566 RepID=A0ABQ3ZN83_9ACTN|nr:hypothetical protein Ahu01nite_031600 [Actinoplanes humidus]